ncbi:MAG: hypothetical protein JWN84_2950, partial [Nocardioides sp.]|nr:hypothetical protein [Nocardioides sp.]
MRARVLSVPLLSGALVLGAVGALP